MTSFDDPEIQRILDEDVEEYIVNFSKSAKADSTKGYLRPHTWLTLARVVHLWVQKVIARDYLQYERHKPEYQAILSALTTRLPAPIVSEVDAYIPRPPKPIESFESVARRVRCGVIARLPKGLCIPYIAFSDLVIKAKDQDEKLADMTPIYDGKWYFQASSPHYYRTLNGFNVTFETIDEMMTFLLDRPEFAARRGGQERLEVGYPSLGTNSFISNRERF